MVRRPVDLTMRTTAIFVMLAVLILAVRAQAPATGAASDSWVGQKVITKLGVTIRAGDDVVDQRNMQHAFFVRRAEGGRLWIESSDHPDVKGFVLPSDVVRYDQAIDYWTDVLKREPGNAQALIARGWHWRIDRNKLGAAIADFTDAIHLDPQNAAGYLFRGGARSGAEDYDGAIADFS